MGFNSYYTESDQHGNLFPNVALGSHDNRSVYRMVFGDILKVYLPSGSLFAQLDTVLVVQDGNGEVREIIFERNQFGGGSVEVEALVGGLLRLSLKCRDALTHDIITGPSSIVVITPKLGIADNPEGLTPEAICLLTVITQKLGSVDNWEKLLRVAVRQKFNAIHFTPVQQLGASNSSYSIADQLAVSDNLVNSSDGNGWIELEHTLRSLKEKTQLNFFTDLVLNHTASNSTFLESHPECGYNEENSPWLRGAIELEEAIKIFNIDLTSGKFQQDYNVSSWIDNDEAVDRLVRAFKERCLDPFDLGRWFSLDIDECIQIFKRATREAGSSSPLISQGEEFAWTESMRQIGVKSIGITLDKEIILRVSRDEHVLRNILHKVQERLWRRCDEIYQSILNSLRGTVRYERIECKKAQIDNTPWNSILPWYFTPVKCDDGRELHLANNGWVMNWKSSDDFAGPGSLVYLGRQLVVWSDCVKLRYGNGPAECPFLWDHMKKYCEITAKYFDGVRLDNCHSTPLHVGKYMMQQCRKVNPRVFVFAELFTGAEEDDIIFEKELGLNALVREAVQTNSPGDLAWHCQKYCQDVYGELPEFSGPMSFESEGVKQLRPTRRLNLFYDCTHDNKTPYENNRPEDLLACAAFVSASNCAVGSTMGYEVGLLKNPSVIADNSYYYSPDVLLQDDIKPTSSDIINRENDNEIQIEWIDSSSRNTTVQLWGSFNGWKSGIELTKCSDHKWTVIIPKKPNDNIEFKFVIDGNWQTSSHYRTQTDSKHNTNNVIGPNNNNTRETPVINLNGSVGIIEARRMLNDIHQYMAQNGFTATQIEYPCDDMAVVSRHNNIDGQAVYFFIRSHWWKGTSQPAVNNITISGKISNVVLAAEISMDWNKASRANDPIINGKHRGMADETACVRPLSYEPHTSYDPERDCTYVNINHLPSGAVYIVQCDVNRNPVKAVHSTASRSNIKKAMENVSLEDLNLLLWSCESEEKDRAYGYEGGKDRGVYQFPGVSSGVYAGWTNIVDTISRGKDERTRFTENIQAGDWLLDYHVDRMSTISSTCNALVDLIRSTVNEIKRSSSLAVSLKAEAVGLLFRNLYSEAQERILNQMDTPLMKNTEELLIKRLAFASTQLIGTVPSSSLSLNPEFTKSCLSAGLPFFANGYMREWGRDTMLSLPGMCLTTGRWYQAEQELLAYASVLRHSLVPNLLDSGSNPRYNARDAVWFWLEALQQYVQLAPNGKEFLNHPVNLKYGNNLGLEYDPQIKVETVVDVVHMIMSCHARGIKYREWNAGLQIDSQMRDEGFNVSIAMNIENGFCVGGNEFNCGTWMDKMGSSEKAGNKGLPSSSRNGAPIELTAACYSCLKWIVDDLIPSGQFKWLSTHGGCDGIKYSDWKDLVETKFDKEYYIDTDLERQYPRIAIAKTYKDVWGGIKPDEDCFLRCNYAVGFCMAPSIAPKHKIAEALNVQYQRLMSGPNQIGMKTLDPENYRYRPDYDNANDSDDKNVAHGWNYHQGPEWVWPAGCWFTARILTCDPSNVGEVYYECIQRIRNISEYIKKAPWFGLPELTNQNGSYCRDSCQTQAWSLATVLWYFHQAYQHLQPTLWTSNSNVTKLQNTIPTTTNSTVKKPEPIMTLVSAAEDPCDDENSLQCSSQDKNADERSVNGVNSAETATYSDVVS